MLEIMTERCCLRPMTDADFPALCRYLQDPGVMYAYGHAFSDREVWDWLRRQQARYVVPGYGALAVELRETGEMIGQCGITLQDCAGVTACTAAADGEEGGQAPAGEEAGPSALLSERIDATPRTLQVPEVGYLLAKNYWHRGYATESARACMEFAFDVLGVPEVFSCIRDDNTPSLAVARRNGMELCGRLQALLRAGHGTPALCGPQGKLGAVVRKRDRPMAQDGGFFYRGGLSLPGLSRIPYAQGSQTGE